MVSPAMTGTRAEDLSLKELMMTRKRIDPDMLWDRPITPEGADILARRHGYRFAGFTPAEQWGELSREARDVLARRFMAVFLPDPDDGSAVVMADGRTRYRAIRRGLEMCRLHSDD